MSAHKHIDRICAVVIVLCMVLTAVLIYAAANFEDSGTAMGYENRLFDTTRVHTIDIVIDDWETFLSTAQEEQYAACSVIIDGEACKNVAIRGKGNTSLSNVASMGSQRYSFKIEFDHYEAGKTYHGLDKLSLNNLIQDATYMKDYLTYRMMQEFGAPAPLCSYAFLTVNGEDWGLYLAVEGIEDAFLQRNYGTDHGDLYKPDTMEIGGGRGNGKDFNADSFFADAPQQGESDPAFAPRSRGEQGFVRDDTQDRSFAERGTAGKGGMGSAETKLQYIDDDPGSYAAIFDSAKTAVTDADEARLIAALQLLSEGDAEASVDIDAVLRYFVVHNFVVNGDSYTGSMIHNYYLYEENGLLSMIPWDYNLAFGTFQNSDAQTAVNDSIDRPLSVTGSGDRPMIDWIFRDEACTALYHQYFAEFLQTVDPAAMASETAALLAPYVQRDPTAFYSLDAFTTGAKALETFCTLRVQSVENQLNGSEETVDAAGLNLSDMGTANMGGNRGGRETMRLPNEQTAEEPVTPPAGMTAPGGMAPPPGMTPPEGTTMPENFDWMPVPPESVIPETGSNAAAPLIVSILILVLGLITVLTYRRRK